MTPHRRILFIAAMIGSIIGSAIGPVTPASAQEAVILPPLTELSAQARPRVRVTPPAAYDYPLPGPYAPPGPGYVRTCQGWYLTEYRPSGTVVTPQMRCRWVRG